MLSVIAGSYMIVVFQEHLAGTANKYRPKRIITHLESLAGQLDAPVQVASISIINHRFLPIAR